MRRASFGHHPTMFRTLSLILGLSCSIVNAQFYAWGWGPPISVTQNGSTITCAVEDPLTGQVRTMSFTSVASWTHDDGVVATVSPTGNVRAVVYDIDLSSYRETQLSSNSGNTVSNVDGVVAWVSVTGIVGGAVYDPKLQQWQQAQFSSNSGNRIQNRDGVVTWVSSTGVVGAAVYDPGFGQWRSTQLSSNSGNTMLNREGIVVYVSGTGIVGAAIYDPSNGEWRQEQFSSDGGNSAVLGQGVVAWKSSTGVIGAAAYDWSSGSWRSAQLSTSSTNTMPTIVDGTVHWTNGGGAQRYGFTADNQWQSDVNTALRCVYHAEVVGSGAPRTAYLWYLSIGASSSSHACGDGHVITRRWAWKRYADPGMYDPQLTVLSSTTSSTCEASLNFVGTAVQENEALSLRVSWNGSHIRVVAEEPVGTVEVHDVGGRLLATGHSNDHTADIAVDPPPGIYIVRADGRSAQRVAVLR